MEMGSLDLDRVASITIIGYISKYVFSYRDLQVKMMA